MESGARRRAASRLVDSNFNQLSYIHALGGEVLVMGVGDSPLQKLGYRGERGRGGVGGQSPHNGKNCDEFRFCSDFGVNSNYKNICLSKPLTFFGNLYNLLFFRF